MDEHALLPSRSNQQSVLTATRSTSADDLERAFCDTLSELTGSGTVTADSNFFEDLHADSLTMAHFCARVRKRPDLPSVSMRDIYRYPTASRLATALADAAPTPAAPTELVVPAVAETPVERPTTATTGQYVLCGALQLLAFLAYVYAGALAFSVGYDWISAGSGVVELYLRSLAVGGVAFVVICTLPVAAKWLLVGRWTPRRIPIWSLGYFRFWLVKVLIRSSPLVLMVGSPVYVLYLKALGARIGRGVAIFSVDVPVCTDLLTVGDGTVIRKDAHFSCYRGQAGMIETGTVTIGRDAVVSESTVLDIDTALGDGAQLAHASSLHAGQRVPDGQRWHGSPGQPTEVDFSLVEPASCSAARRFAFGAAQLLTVLVVYMPLALGGVAVAVAEMSRLTGAVGATVTTSSPVIQVLLTSLVVFAAVVLAGVLAVFVLGRLMHLAFTPGRVYPLYGFHYSLHRSVTRLTNVRFFNELFGNSSYVVPYLQRLGYDVSRAEQTGSNFGTEFKHETPYLVSVGRGTMVADGLSVMNAEYSSTSFRLAPTAIGAHNFLGNRIAYPSRGRTGDNCLLATKVMVPIDGPVRTDVGLLGSPSFEIPRSVERDARFDHYKSGDALAEKLAAKNRYNLATMGLFLLTRWLHFLGLTAVFFVTDFYHRYGVHAVAAEVVLALLFSMVYCGLLERAAAGFRPLSPHFCSIYDPYFWWHERFWKFEMNPRLVKLLGGTPFKNVLSRLLGVRLGRRVFDDDCSMPERTLVSVGDDCTLNAGSVIQSHSQEDGAFKSDHIVIGNGCTVGAGALVHYGSTLGDASVVAPDAFLMKGTEVVPETRWAGNPAREVGRASARPALEPAQHRRATPAPAAVGPR